MSKYDERYFTNMTNPLKRIYIIKSNNIKIYKIPLKIILDLFLVTNNVIMLLHNMSFIKLYFYYFNYNTFNF